MKVITDTERLYSAQDVATRCGIALYSLKYWEMNFPDLQEQTKGHEPRRYSTNDIALILRIKKLLYIDHLTLEQAIGRIETEKAFPVNDPTVAFMPRGSHSPAQPHPATVQEPSQSHPQVSQLELKNELESCRKQYDILSFKLRETRYEVDMGRRTSKQMVRTMEEIVHRLTLAKAQLRELKTFLNISADGSNS